MATITISKFQLIYRVSRSKKGTRRLIIMKTPVELSTIYYQWRENIPSGNPDAKASELLKQCVLPVAKERQVCDF